MIGPDSQPLNSPLIPAVTLVPWPVPTSQPPGLAPATVTNLPEMKSSRSENVPSELLVTVNLRLYVSFAQSLPHVPESGDAPSYGPFVFAADTTDVAVIANSI